MGGLLAISSTIDRVNSFIGRSVSWLILLAIFVSTINAIIRYMFDRSSNAWLELQWYLFGAAFLLAAAYTLMENEHIRIDILYGSYSRRKQHWIDLFGHAFFLMPMVILSLYLMWPWLVRSINSGEHSNNTGGLLLWPIKAILFSGFILLLLQGISEIIKKIAVLRGLIEDPHPPAGHNPPLELDPDLVAHAGFSVEDLDLNKNEKNAGGEKRS